MEWPSKPPPDDFPAIGGRGRIDGELNRIAPLAQMSWMDNHLNMYRRRASKTIEKTG